MPVGTADGAEAVAAAPAPDGAGDGEGGDGADEADEFEGGELRTKSAAMQALRQIREEKSHQLEFAAHCFANVRHKRMAGGLVCLFEPLEYRHKTEMHQLHSVQGTADLMMNLVSGGFCKVYGMLWNRFTSPELADELFMSRRCTDLELREHQNVASRLWTCLLHTIGGLEVLNLLYTSTPPYCFLRATVDDVDRDVFEYFKECDEVLHKLDKASFRSVDARSFVRGLVFPENPMVREIFVSLQETQYRFLAGSVLDELVRFKCCQQSTLMNENMNRGVHAAEKQTRTES